jgi:formate dehydrogenase assembly factor FdhD
MTNPPQNVTSRYARNLLVKGENNEYTVVSMMRRTNMIDDFVIGYYYAADIVATGTRVTKMAIGVTPEQAVNRCLVKHGVTFR